MRPTFWTFLLLLACFMGGPSGWADEADRVHIQIRGASTDRGETPCRFTGARLPLGRYLLRPLSGGPTLPMISCPAGAGTEIAFIVPETKAHEEREYEVIPDLDRPKTNSGIVFQTEGRRVVVEGDGVPWTTYVPDDGPKPYFDPLFGPGGVPLTRAYPMREVTGEPRDHPHHRSMWFAHQDVNQVNTWDQNPGHGSIREAARPVCLGIGGPAGVLETRNDWLDRDRRKICEDERRVVFWATKSARVLDFDVTLHATEGSVTMGDNKDGTFAVRLAAPLAVTAGQGGQIVTSRGLRDKAAWGQVAEWVDCSGPLDGKVRGVAILCHPSGFRSPTTWHVRDYGLFAANPFGWHDFGQKASGSYTITRGESIRLAYRVILHDGDATVARIADQYLGYAQALTVSKRGSQ